MRSSSVQLRRPHPFFWEKAATCEARSQRLALHLLSCGHNMHSDSPLHCMCAGVRGDEHGSMGTLTGHDTAPQVSPFFEESEEFFQCHDYEKHRHHGAGSPQVRFLNTGRFATCPLGPRTLSAELWGNAHLGT